MKIVVDAFGGDYAPLEIVKGAITSVNLLEDVSIILAGDKDKIVPILDEFGYKGDKIEIIDAKEVITNDDSPTSAIRVKKNSSIVEGLNRLKNDEDVVGFISAGSTGAVLAGGTFLIGRMENVLRPSLAPMMPTVDGGKVILVDSGANVDCKPEYLEQFAIMGSVYMNSMLSIDKPRVGLLNIGAEEHKGNMLTHEAYELLKNNKSINFIGNIEARDLLSGKVDVVVADGFAGNIALKASEGTALLLMKTIKKTVSSGGIFAKLGALLLKNKLKQVKNQLDYNSFGGSPFLGVNKIVLKTHGTTKAETLFDCVKQVKEIHKSGFIDKLRSGFADKVKGE